MLKKIWNYLEGKKRRIALLAALAAQVIPEPTTKIILNGVAIILGGADAANAIKKVK